MCSYVDDFKDRSLFLTANLLNKVINSIKFGKHFLNSTTVIPGLIVKYYICLKTLLNEGISEPIFYDDLVYKFKRIVGKPSFSDQF